MFIQFLKIREEYGESILKKFRDSKATRKHYEYFLIKTFLYKKTKLTNLSCLDGCDLKSNSKGPRLKLTKKNLDAHYISEHKDGIEIINKTRNWFNFFDTDFDLKLTDYSGLYNSFNSKTFLSREKDFGRVLFLDLSSKQEFYETRVTENNYKHLIKLKKRNEYLTDIGEKLNNKKKIIKIPVYFCFYFKEKDKSISFSNTNSIFWFKTFNSLLSK